MTKQITDIIESMPRLQLESVVDFDKLTSPQIFALFSSSAKKAAWSSEAISSVLAALFVSQDKHSLMQSLFQTSNIQTSKMSYDEFESDDDPMYTESVDDDDEFEDDDDDDFDDDDNDEDDN